MFERITKYLFMCPLRVLFSDLSDPLSLEFKVILKYQCTRSHTSFEKAIINFCDEIW